ncbi:MAG: energy transducer TonB [Candidatus Dadabacteria bacterium]|nr:energy transducer TonB [Candidatus Dadabacteria bacterium]
MVRQIHIRRRSRRRKSKLMPYILGSTVIFILILLFVHLFLIDILHLRSKLAKEPPKQPEFIEITELPVPKEKETKPPKVTKRLAERSHEAPVEKTRDRITKRSASTPPVPPTVPKAAVKPKEQPKKVEKKPQEEPRKQMTRSDITRQKEVASLPQKQLEKEKKRNKNEVPNLTKEQLFSSAPQPQTLPQNQRNPQDFLGAPNVDKKEDTVDLSTTEFKYLSYFIKLKRQIESVWNYPQESRYRREQGTLLLVFTIRSNGDLESVQLLTSSGFARLDHEALRAITSAAPYAPFPKSWGGLERLNIRATFEYGGRRIF